MAGEGQLPVWGENAQAVVGSGVVGWEDEGRLGQVRPVRDAGHLRVIEAIGIDDDRDGVALEGHGREHIDLGESAVL